MRILYSDNQDPMLLGSIQELNSLHLFLRDFLVSAEPAFLLKTDTSGSPLPYKEHLMGIRFIKTTGPIFANITNDRIFQVSGSTENLEIYFKYFSFREDEEGNHHHPEYVLKEGYMAPGTMSLIIEADYSDLEA
jgi:hypothetical protein